MKVTVFGSGYVGLVTAACFADSGSKVVCVDVDAKKIETLLTGTCPFYEPGLDAILARNIKAGRIEFTTNAKKGVDHGLFQFIAVGTPPQEDGSADLQHVLAVARTIAEHMSDYKVVCTKSTVPVGTADKVRDAVSETLSERNSDLEFDVVSNPEFLKEGAAVEDFQRPDRIIVGTENPRTAELMRALYAPFNRHHDRLLVMDIRSAELTKYAANAMLATRISFMNELSILAERTGADIQAVRHGIGSDPRIGYDFIYAGAGYGGSCFPKDVKALIQTGGESGVPMTLLKSVDAVNEEQKKLLFKKIVDHYGDISGKTFGLWGLAFKPNTDDMREAPSRTLMEALWAAGAKVRAYDPVAHVTAREIYGDREDLDIVDSAEAACEGADALVIITEWREFRAQDLGAIRRHLKDPVIFDGRNQFDPEGMQAAEFTYHSIGRQPVYPKAD